MSFNVAVVILLGDRLGVGGIALISAIATLVNLAINVAVSHKMDICRFTLRDVLDFAVSVVSAAAMIPAVMFISSRFSSSLVQIVLSVAAAAPIYFIASFILRSEEAKFIVGTVRKKLRRI